MALLGDSAHAMQPNLGQGGCMAIEDAYELAIDLSKAVAVANGDAAAVNVGQVLQLYQSNRMMRVSTIHGMAGMAAFMASTYKCYFGEGWSKWVENLRIPHPGRVVGRLMMMLTMPAVLDWVLGGNTEHLATNRVQYCSLGDKPKAFEESRFGEFMANDASIVYSSHADWLLVSERAASATSAGGVESANSSCECKGIYMSTEPALVGCSGSSLSPALSVDDVHTHERHALVWREDGDGSSDTNSINGGVYFLQDLATGRGTWMNGHRLQDGATVRLWPGDLVEFGRHPSLEVFKVKMQHVTLRSNELQGSCYSTLLVGKVRESNVETERGGVLGRSINGDKLVAA